MTFACYGRGIQTDDHPAPPLFLVLVNGACCLNERDQRAEPPHPASDAGSSVNGAFFFLSLVSFYIRRQLEQRKSTLKLGNTEAGTAWHAENASATARCHGNCKGRTADWMFAASALESWQPIEKASFSLSKKVRQKTDQTNPSAAGQHDRHADNNNTCIFVRDNTTYCHITLQIDTHTHPIFPWVTGCAALHGRQNQNMHIWFVR